jgi:arsenical pump membrane protein
VIALFHKRRPLELARTLLRLPWQLVPFVLSMFVLVLSLDRYGVTERLAELLSGTDPLFSYGVLSFLCSNLLNNIPMSVLFSSILQSSGLSGTAYLTGVYATVIGSNIGAYLTPLGALAGIMWSSLLTRSGISLSFRRFVRYGILLSVPTMLAALLGLMIVL